MFTYSSAKHKVTGILYRADQNDHFKLGMLLGVGELVCGELTLMYLVGE